MNEITEAFIRIIPVRHSRSGGGWITFDCPACGDRRGRGGFLETPTGGWRYSCFNGGCEFERSTGWEPGSGFFGRPRRLFEMMGGDIADIPRKYLRGGAHFAPRQPREVATAFPEISLPEGSMLLWTATSPDALACQDYLRGRGPTYEEEPFIWCPQYPRHVIFPCRHEGKIVGWLGRKIDPGKQFAHIKCPGFPPDYMLDQDRLFDYDTVLVAEGLFDALPIQGQASFGNTLTRKQINLLNRGRDAGRRIALIPDLQKDEWKSYWQTAKDNSWYLSCPKWQSDNEPHIKDVGDSVKYNGLLWTIECVLKDVTNDYDYAWRFYQDSSRQPRSVRGDAATQDLCRRAVRSVGLSDIQAKGAKKVEEPSSVSEGHSLSEN